MCGRFTLTTPAEVLAEQFLLAEIPELSPRYNIAPGQQVPTVRLVVQEQGRRCHLLRWGLVPSWARDIAATSRMINARSETAEQRPAFGSAFRRRRCLVLADGFFEWRRGGRPRQPYLVRLRDGRPFALAGLWERWVSPEGEVVESCTLLTTTPNELVQEIHDRMPVILPPAAHDLWLDPELCDPARLRSLLVPYPAEEMVAFPVSLRINSPANDSPQVLDPAGPALEPGRKE